MPWKNGGGETAEVAVFPAHASIDGFDWRISLATVAGSGDFSSFPGVNRTLCVLSDNPVFLAIDGAAPVLLTRDSAPFGFPADKPVAATLSDGAVSDLNVMTRRGRWSHGVTRRREAGLVALKARGRETLCVLAAGRFSLPRAGADVSPLDALFIAGDRSVDLLFAEPTTVYVIALVPAG